MNRSGLAAARRELRAKASRSRARASQWFFKTGPGEYGEGDVFIGVVTPDIRRISRRYRHLALKDLSSLITSGIHEERILAAYILVLQYRAGDERRREAIYRFYLRNLNWVNNWDIVDVSCPHIVGAYLSARNRKLLYRLARSPRLWFRRVAIISTGWFIRDRDFKDTFAIARLLLGDREDLIHKAVGWMLREVGNRDRRTEEAFLKRHAGRMPRTMLRYAIEKFPEPLRRKYLRAAPR